MNINRISNNKQGGNVENLLKYLKIIYIISKNSKKSNRNNRKNEYKIKYFLFIKLFMEKWKIC